MAAKKKRLNPAIKNIITIDETIRCFFFIFISSLIKVDIILLFKSCFFESLDNKLYLFSYSITCFFHFYKNSIDIMKYREIYGLLGATIKKCRDAAGMIEEMPGKR